MATALFLFDESTVMAQPWAEAGYLCYCVDIQHKPGESRDGNIIKVGADIDHIIPLCDGGDHHETNMQVLCRDCHREKTALEAVERVKRK